MRLSLLARFSIVSLGVMAALGIAVGTVLHQRIEHRALSDARRLATTSGQIAAAGALRPADLTAPVSGEALARLDLRIADALDGSGILRTKIYNQSRVVVWSDDHRLLGAAGDGEVAEALEGETEAELGEGTEDVGGGERVLEVYVPLRLPSGDGTPDGAFELYLPYGPVAADIAADTRTVGALLAGGLLVLWLSLFGLVGTASRRLRRQALHDDLTGLANRARLRDHGTRLLGDSAREGASAALLLVDLDRFKDINDTLGHEEGDRLLREAAGRLEDVLRRDDLLARLGGDEFAILLPRLPHRGAAAELATRVRSALERPFELAGVAVEVEASIGIAVFPEDGEDIATLLRRADVAMYDAKDSRSGIEAYDGARDPHSPERLTLLADLRRGLERDELVLYFQPKVDLPSGAVTGVEALIRWQHPERGLLGPGDFLPLAERTGLIGDLTQWVLDRALTQVAVWRAEGRTLPVAVNLAAANVLDVRLPDLVAAALARHDLPGEVLICEISENTVLADPRRTVASLERLRAMGVGLALDDFGAGQSSMSYLKRLPLDELKIDRSFVAGMAADDSDAAIVRATIDLGRHLGLRIVAEGVETGDVLADLTGLRCDVVQGFLVSRPLPVEELEAWLAAQPPAPATAL